MSAPKVNSSILRSRLKLKNLQAQSLFHNHHPRASAIFSSHAVKPGRLRHHAAKLASQSAIVASIVLPASSSLPPTAPVLAPTQAQIRPAVPADAQTNTQTNLQSILPTTGRLLTPSQEIDISNLIYQNYGIKSSAELEGNRLNDSYGFIGAEQHLPRFPGDTVTQHDELQQAGITPGRGAWGYFAPSKSALTADLIAKEKYYFAVQTLYLPDWETRLPYLRTWYKYRKMIAVNPANGKAIVGVVADAGPTWWTGKQFGGSPEIMNYLQMKDGKQKGKVILFFVDDTQNPVPLGPVEYNRENPPLLLAS